MKLIPILTATCSLLLLTGNALAGAASKWKGYLLDKSCSQAVKDDSDPYAFIKNHTKDCALMGDCKAVGYGLYSQKKWFDLDKHGNELAIKVLENSKKNSGFYVEITGNPKGKTLQVESIKEIDEPKPE